MIKKSIIFFLMLIILLFSRQNAYSDNPASLNFTVTIPQSDIPPEPSPTPSPTPDGGGGKGVGGGTVVGITGASTAGASAVGTGIAQAAIFLAGDLTPGTITGAAAPIMPSKLTPDLISTIYSDPKQNLYLIKSMKYMGNQLEKKDSILINDSVIAANTYSIAYFNIPASNKPINIKIVQGSQSFGENDFLPELDFRVFVNADEKYLTKIFKTKRYVNYFDHKKEISLMPNKLSYKHGLYVKNGVIFPSNTIRTVAIVTTYKTNSSVSLIKYAYYISLD